ncbi:MAG: peptide chain release factor 2 [Bdellovibrionales bacterium]
MSIESQLPEMKSLIQKLIIKADELRGYFDVDTKKKRLEELERASQNPDIWNSPKEMQKIEKEKAAVGKTVSDWEKIKSQLDDFEILVEMSESGDEESFQELERELPPLETSIGELETQSLLNGEMDSNSAYLTINSGAGGTEASDWAGMIMRMYSRYAEKNGWKVGIVEMTEGEEAGIKSVTLHLEGPYAYGLLKAENGVHRLVRISPFDSNARRHTSFAAVHAWPEVDEDIDVEVKTEDLRIDTYRASGKGGQHVNRTDSAVRMTHIPTNIVVQCQSERSQIQNREKCMKMLKAALYEKEMEKRQAEKDATESAKKANEWGSQIRSYVLHPYQMVKDHRTSVESGSPQNVLDGDLNVFIESYLKEQAIGRTT